MAMDLWIMRLDFMTALLLVLLPWITTQAAIQDTVGLSQCSQQCHNQGDCVRESGAVLSCRCHPGWGGDACSTQCAKSCLNGKCIISDGKQTCHCLVGYHGDECQHSGYSVWSMTHTAKLLSQKWDKAMPLVKDPTKDIDQNIQRGSSSCSNNFRCQHGGKCRRGVLGGFRCECDISKHTGTFCQFTCPQSCLNGGKCVRLRKSGISFTSSDSITLRESEAQYSCVCIDSFSGSRCQDTIKSSSSDIWTF